MRKRQIAALALFGLIFGISGAAYVSNKSARKPASTTGRIPWPLPPKLEKHLSLFRIELKAEQIPESNDEETDLVGRILVNQELQGDLKYTWSLPEGVHVVEGNISDSLAGARPGQIVEVKLTVTGFSKEKQNLISLQAIGKKGTEVLGNSAVIASRPEDTWEAVAPDMKKSAEEQLGGGRPGR